MLIKGLLATQMSGSLDGITASHNSGGQYFRARALPTDPNSTAQQAVRAAMGSLVNRWNDTLTQTQRDAWETYAANVTVLNRLGDPVQISGLAHFIRSNVPRAYADPAQSDLPIVDDGPTTFNLGQTPIITSVTPAAAGSDIAIAWAEGLGQNAWVGIDDAGLIVQCSRAQNLTINFFKAPFRLCSALLGDSAAPLASPQNVTNPYGEVYGATGTQRVFVRARVTLDDGRLSEWVILNGLTA